MSYFGSGLEHVLGSAPQDDDEHKSHFFLVHFSV